MLQQDIANYRISPYFFFSLISFHFQCGFPTVLPPQVLWMASIVMKFACTKPVPKKKKKEKERKIENSEHKKEKKNINDNQN